MNAPAPASPDRWEDARVAAAMLAIDPDGLGGIRLRARSGPLRDRWLDDFLGLMPPRAPRRRIPAGIDAARLVGCIDVAATLRTGRRVMETGLLAEADRGVVVLAMAERVTTAVAAIIAGALDQGSVRIEREGFSGALPARFALIALDEGIGDDETPPAALRDRLGLSICLDEILSMPPPGDAFDPASLERARQLVAEIDLPDTMAEALAGIAMACGEWSMRRTLFVFRAARAAAAVHGRRTVAVEDAARAARLVLGEQALAEMAAQSSAPPDAPAPPPPDAPDDAPSPEESAAQFQDMILEAAAAVLPEGLLDGARRHGASRDLKGDAGRSGAERSGAPRGRVVGVVSRPPYPGARIDLLATLRTATPWQRLRGGGPATEPTGRIAPLRIRPDDFRYARRREKKGTTAIFAVDASGSAAVARLAETKGAVELLLAECYVRRDQVALVSFRGDKAEIMLEPTRSLVRAKRMLSALPGGGGTPLASGIVATLTLAEKLKRKGQDVISVFLTDGRGNIGLDGKAGREAAAGDAALSARRFRALGLRGLVIDTARQPQAALKTLAGDLGADYVALPRGGSERISREISARMEG